MLIRSGNRHVVDQNGTTTNAAAKVDVLTNLGNAFKHGSEVGGNSHLLHGMIEFAIFHPETGGPRE